MKHKKNFTNNNSNKNRKKSFTSDTVFVPGLRVAVRENDFNFALRKFKKKVQESGLLQELREREFYIKPSEAKKKNKAAARARWLKKQRSSNPVQFGNRKGR